MSGDSALSALSGCSAVFGGVAYDLRDEFTDTRAAGSVDGTPATPGPGNRTLNDTGNHVSIANGALTIDGGESTWGDPRIEIGNVSRVAGTLLIASITRPDTLTNAPVVGFAPTATPETRTYFDAGLFFGSGGELMDAYGGMAISTFSANVAVLLAIAVRATGHYIFINEGGDWKLFWVSDQQNGATLYAVYSNYATAFTSDYIRVPSATWLPTPLAYDSFTRSDGALGSTETTGPDSQAVTARTWNNRIGTTQISSNAASASALSGGLAIATVDCGKLDVLHGAELTRSAGNVGIVVRYEDDQNYVIAYHDGTNAKLDKVVGGVTTNVISAAAPYSAGAMMWVTVEDTSFSLYYNNAKIGSTSTISDAALQTGTEVGLYSTDMGNSQDDMKTWARGTGGEYSALNRY